MIVRNSLIQEELTAGNVIPSRKSLRLLCEVMNEGI